MLMSQRDSGMGQQNGTSRSDLAAADVLSLLSLLGLILLTGILISLYAVLVHQLSVRTSSEDSLRQATQFVAEELARTSIYDSEFGEVGICDLTAGHGERKKNITSLNRLYATLRLNNLVAKRVNAAYMARMVEQDYEQLHRLEINLRSKLQDIVAPNANNSVYSRVYSLASGGRKGAEEVVDVRIKLGAIKSTQLNSGMPATEDPSERSNLSVRGLYLARFEIPITSTGTAQFTQSAPEIQFIDNAEFVETDSTETPSAVLVESTFKTSDRAKKIDLVRTRSAVAILGPTNASAPDSVLMVSFPQGMVKPFNSLRSVISCASRVSNNSWQQAVGGDVPGSGYLAIARQIEPVEMRSAQAIQTAFYHWLRSLGPSPKLDSIVETFDKSWWGLEVRRNDDGPAKLATVGANSALTQDSGASAFALLNQSSPGAVAHKVLKTAFDAEADSTSMPSSAVPLMIDELGNCNLPGRGSFDRVLVQDVLTAIYRTNLLSNESISFAKSLINRMEEAEAQADRGIELLKEELSSLEGRRRRLEAAKDEANAAEIARLQKAEQQLSQSIEKQSTKRNEFQVNKERANTVLINAESAARASFDLCSNMAKYANSGIYRCQDKASYLFGSEYVFHPITTEISLEDIYRGKSPWLRPIDVLEPAEDGIIAEGKTVGQRRRTQVRDGRAVPAFVIIDSRELQRKAPKVVLVSRSPFAETGIPNGDLAYYSPDSLRTGQQPPVGWSLLIRDAVGNLSLGASSIPSSHNKWCVDEPSVGTCPGLAVEIQIRSPIPMIPELGVGSFVVNPTTHERSSQIPPRPATML